MTKLRKALPPLGTLVAFDAAYRLHSFSRAADEIALSQASISRQIRELEDNLGQPLVVFHTVLQITGDIWSESLTGERIGAVT